MVTGHNIFDRPNCSFERWKLINNTFMLMKFLNINIGGFWTAHVYHSFPASEAVACIRVYGCKINHKSYTCFLF